MEMRLRLLESFQAAGSDGATYKVCAYDRLAPDPSAHDDVHWESTGQMEYRLADGRLVDLGRDGTARINGSGVQLSLPERKGMRDTLH